MPVLWKQLESTLVLGLMASCGDDGGSMATSISTSVSTTTESGTSMTGEPETGQSTGSGSSTGGSGTESTTGGIGCENDRECEPDEICELDSHSCLPAGDTWSCKWLCMRQVACMHQGEDVCMTACENALANFAGNPECLEALNQLWYCASQVRDCTAYLDEMNCVADAEICADACMTGEKKCG